MFHKSGQILKELGQARFAGGGLNRTVKGKNNVGSRRLKPLRRGRIRGRSPTRDRIAGEGMVHKDGLVISQRGLNQGGEKSILKDGMTHAATQKNDPFARTNLKSLF